MAGPDISSASSSSSILNMLKWAASLAFSHNHSKPFNQNMQRRHQTNVCHMSPSQKSLMVQRRAVKVSYALGRVGKIRELTFLAADVNVMSQNSLNMMLQTKIWTPPPTPDHVRTDMFGPGWSPTGWPGGRNHNSWSRNSFRASPREKTGKVRGGPGSLAHQTLGGTVLDIGPPACWPRGHIPDILPSNRGILGSSQRTDVLLTTCVAEWGDLWSHCSSSTCRLTVVWATVSYGDTHPSLGHQEFISTLIF